MAAPSVALLLLMVLEARLDRGDDKLNPDVFKLMEDIA
jgi:hypothetical protein